MADFTEIDTDDALPGLPVSSEHRAVQWKGGEGEIHFSWTRKGNALMIHFQSNGKGLRNVRKACDLFCMWLFEKYEWCEMLLTNVTPDKSSIGRMIEKIDWRILLEHDSGIAYARMRSWADLEQQ